jgi:hypothetical protein
MTPRKQQISNLTVSPTHAGARARSRWRIVSEMLHFTYRDQTRADTENEQLRRNF